MSMRFTITDYTYDINGVDTVIDEPIGWDGIHMRLKRDKTWHGFFDFIDDSLTSLRYHGNAYTILKNAYELKGIEANVLLKIEYKCSETDAFEELYKGRFMFVSYAEFCGKDCAVEVGLESSTCIMKLRNRYDQKVNLDDLSTFDDVCVDDTSSTTGIFVAPNQITLLASYPGIAPGQTIDLSGTVSNNGTFTVVTASINFSGYTEIEVVEAIVDEAPASVTISGCIELLTLPAYNGLNKPLLLKGKEILYTNEWQMNTPYNKTFSDGLFAGRTTSDQSVHILAFEWNRIILSEIRDSDPFEYFKEAFSGALSDYVNQYNGIVKNSIASGLQCSSDFDIELNLEGAIDFETNDNVNWTGRFFLLYGQGADPNSGGDYQAIPLTPAFGSSGLNTYTYNVNINYSGTITLRPNDKLYLHFIMTNVQYFTGPTDAFQIDINFTTAYLKITNTSVCEQSFTKGYYINEVFSRIAEKYTNDCLRVYSEYFGRTNSQPYATETTGCGALEMLTNGLKIRGAKLQNNQEPSLTVSMKDVFDGMNAIHNIGMGLEEDTDRPGEMRLRIEPYKFFYQDDDYFSLEFVNEIKKSAQENEFYSLFKVGYQKWETETNNGLNDMFATREYRTEISTAKNTLDRICKFIASDYAIEVTRREFGKNTKDWKYDNDTFIICVDKRVCAQARFFSETSSMTLIGLYGELFELGDEITITGSASNDGTYTIALISVNAGENFTNIQFEETVNNQSDFLLVCIENITNPFAVNETFSFPDSISASLLFPNTTSNIRITPARNAMRHFSTLMQALRNYAQSKLKFTSGEGNFAAEIEIDADFDDCLNEDTLLKEFQDISASDFADSEFAKPLFYDELDEFEYPLTYAQFKTIAANPYKYIRYSCIDANWRHGWIIDLKYQPRTGMAEFTLKPKIES